MTLLLPEDYSGLVAVDHNPFEEASPQLPGADPLPADDPARGFAESEDQGAAASPEFGAGVADAAKRFLAQPSVGDLMVQDQDSVAQRERELGRPLSLRERLDLSQSPAAAIGLGFAGGGPEDVGGQLELPLRQAGITAYHGSPHDFPAFSSEKIGTGEGMQVYGHGLYFADKPEVAESYKPLARPSADDIARIINEETGAAPSADLVRSIPWDVGADNPYLADEATNLVARQRELRSIVDDDPSFLTPFPTVEKILSRVADLPTAAHMYQVNLNVDPKALLDWDRPMSQQPQPVLDAIKRYSQEHFTVNPDNFPDMTGERLYEHLIDFGPLALSRDERAPMVATNLRSAGLPGLQYLDQYSRGLAPDAPEATRNYVIFDDKLIDILKKYGLGALIGGGLATLAGNADAATHGVPVDHNPFLVPVDHNPFAGASP